MHIFSIVGVILPIWISFCRGEDCSTDLCTCLENTIICDNLYRAPDLMPMDKSTITSIYINYGYLPSLTWMNGFENLQLLSLMEVFINCTLVEKSHVKIQGSNCPGM